MARKTKPKAPKPKKVSYELIAADGDIGRPMYRLCKELVKTHHRDLWVAEARIALAWCTSWKPDPDGRETLGKCKKASDLDRELAEFDFIILLNRGFWYHEQVTDIQRRALLDHELMHAAVKHDTDGEFARDVRDRPVFRMRKHDLEEFADIVERYGCYKRDIETFVAHLRRSPQANLFVDEKAPKLTAKPDAPSATAH
jgi:hypothetical protein